ncbi:MAG: gliding motility-associated ABC transporter ATP-binding subunit GldA [Bacteroidetes bacterium]|nr:gliding motility-associated ABC transporter ATP-binding subunit GldA [Bacteroidota bacterium]
MSVRVEGLTKNYGEQKAVDNLSFHVEKGQILGFLGPNGAGKSTTMKILTGYLVPTEGFVEIDGLDVQAFPKEIRQRIGYLPENNPLYGDMYIKEYLHFVAGFYEIKNITARVSEVIDLVGLTPEKHKKIGELSKGYKQRVGLAQAIIHDPQVLILDEPTTGLDPNQLMEIRSLIKDLGKEKTLIFSTHIMQEVNALCDRVLIIKNGQVLANDTLQNLQASLQGEWITTVTFEGLFTLENFKNIKNVKRILPINKQTIQVITPPGVDVRSLIFKQAVQDNTVIIGLEQERRSVEEIFQKLTGS